MAHMIYGKAAVHSSVSRVWGNDVQWSSDNLVFDSQRVFEQARMGTVKKYPNKIVLENGEMISADASSIVETWINPTSGQTERIKHNINAADGRLVTPADVWEYGQQLNQRWSHLGAEIVAFVRLGERGSQTCLSIRLSGHGFSVGHRDMSMIFVVSDDMSGLRPFEAYLGLIVAQCWNTFSAGVTTAKNKGRIFSSRHSKNFDFPRFSELETAINLAEFADRLAEERKKFELLANTKLGDWAGQTIHGLVTSLETMVLDPEASAAISLASADGTLTFEQSRMGNHSAIGRKILDCTMAEYAASKEANGTKTELTAMDLAQGITRMNRDGWSNAIGTSGLMVEHVLQFARSAAR